MLHSYEVEVLNRRRQSEAIEGAERERELRAAGVERPLIGLPNFATLVAHLVRGRAWAERRREPALRDATPRMRAARP